MMSFSYEFKELVSCIPKIGQPIDWPAIESTSLSSVLLKMANTPQDPRYHGEGSVYEHTKAVCESIVTQKIYTEGSDNDRNILFLAALLHDIGKIRCTKYENGKIVSPHHSSLGAVMARELLWREFGLCGSKESQNIRESICLLIRYHSFPPFAAEETSPERKILRIAANGELAEGFSMKKLYALEHSDVCGRISTDNNEYLERIEYFRLLCEDLGCFNRPFPFSDSFSKRAYFKEKTDWKEEKLFDSTYGPVFLMSGLPGTGKDTYINDHFTGIPVISLDEIRNELGISPTEAQGPVVSLARERARELLRQKVPFVWNATNITYQLRKNLIELFENYGACVNIVFLETGYEEELARNESRTDSVPNGVIEKMISKLEPPEAFEAQNVNWHIV